MYDLRCCKSWAPTTSNWARAGARPQGLGLGWGRRRGWGRRGPPQVPMGPRAHIYLDHTLDENYGTYPGYPCWPVPWMIMLGCTLESGWTFKMHLWRALWMIILDRTLHEKIWTIPWNQHIFIDLLHSVFNMNKIVQIGGTQRANKRANH